MKMQEFLESLDSLNTDALVKHICSPEQKSEIDLELIATHVSHLIHCLRVRDRVIKKLCDLLKVHTQYIPCIEFEGEEATVRLDDREK